MPVIALIFSIVAYVTGFSDLMNVNYAIKLKIALWTILNLVVLESSFAYLVVLLIVYISRNSCKGSG